MDDGHARTRTTPGSGSRGSALGGAHPLRPVLQPQPRSAAARGCAGRAGRRKLMASDISARDLVNKVWDEVAAERALRPAPAAGLDDYDRLVEDAERHYV